MKHVFDIVCKVLCLILLVYACLAILNDRYSGTISEEIVTWIDVVGVVGVLGLIAQSIDLVVGFLLWAFKRIIGEKK